MSNEHATPYKAIMQFACQNIQQRPGIQITIDLSIGYANTSTSRTTKCRLKNLGFETKVSQDTKAVRCSFKFKVLSFWFFSQ